MQIDRPIAIALILLVVILLVYFLVYPEYQKFNSLRLKLGQKIAEFNAQYEYYAAITATHDDIVRHANEIKKIDTALPTDPPLGKLIYFIQKKVMENGLILNSMFLSKTGGTRLSENLSVNDMVVSISIKGDYPALESFMRSLEDSDRLFEITTITFGAGSAPSVSQGQTQFQAQQTFSFGMEVRTHSY
jgi:Tfp pilus assembly protein PilO